MRSNKQQNSKLSNQITVLEKKNEALTKSVDKLKVDLSLATDRANDSEQSLQKAEDDIAGLRFFFLIFCAGLVRREFQIFFSFSPLLECFITKN